jgi:hypothetical protein
MYRRSSSPTFWGFLSGALVVIAVDAARWFFTPHADATTTRGALAAAQLVIGAVLALWAWRRGSSLERGGGSGKETSTV